MLESIHIKKIRLHNKYINIKQNEKFKNKLMRTFKVLDLFDKKVYKLEFSKNLLIYNVFFILLLN